MVELITNKANLFNAYVICFEYYIKFLHFDSICKTVGRKLPGNAIFLKFA